jgi:hypothetical protein
LIVSLKLNFSDDEQSYQPVLENGTLYGPGSGSGFRVLEVYRVQHRDLSHYGELDKQYADGGIDRHAGSTGYQKRKSKPT